MVFPAHAGMNRNLGDEVALRVGVPRTRGDEPDFLGNCTAIRTGRLAYPEDVKAVTKVMGVPPAKVEALRPLEWLEKDMATGRMSSGVLTF